MSGADETPDEKAGRLEAEKSELQDRLDRLEREYSGLSLRLQNLESSVIFRILRWLGVNMTRLGLPIPGVASQSPAALAMAAEERYAVWAQEQALLRNMAAGRKNERESSIPLPGITVLIDAQQAEPEKFARTLSSLAAQDHHNWRLLVYAGPLAPVWIAQYLQQYTAGHPAEVIAAPDSRQAWTEALERGGAEFVALVHPHALLDSGALAAWVAAAAPDVAAVYSDWDHIDQAGRFHLPRFTPELSRELLSQTPYWGDCYLVRKTALLASPWPAAPSGHELAVNLAASSKPIRRVPRMLWHLQAPPAPIPASVPGRPEQVARASLIVCSRNPARLDSCLRALRPTLKDRHEVVVVAHAPSGSSASLELERTSTKWGARMVPYQGPFHFGEMNRLGVEASGHQVLCLVNDDIVPLAPDWLEWMLAQAVRPDVGVVGALLLYPDRTIQHAGISVGRSPYPAHIGRGLTASPYWPWLRVTREVSAVTGACMAMRRAVWDELSGFDIQFPTNYNDVDLCLRASERGYRVILEARAILIHKEAQTRLPVVRPEESQRFRAIWRKVVNAPDKFYNPQLMSTNDSIQLPPPWTPLR